MFRSARRRLVAWNLLVFAAVLCLLELAVYGVFTSNVYSEVDDQLRFKQSQILETVSGYAGNVTAAIHYHITLAQPPYRTVVADSAGQVQISPTDCPQAVVVILTALPPCPPDSMSAVSLGAMQHAAGTGSDLRTAWFRNEPQRVLTFRVLNGDGSTQALVQISRTATGEENASHQLRLLLVFGDVLALILAGAGSLFLADRSLVPIRQAFSRQRQFTADASHELRTPLALIRANAEMLARHSDGYPDGDGELIGDIINETDHLNRLVGDLLTLARADSGGVKLITKPVDFRALVADVHDDLQRLAEDKGVETTLALDGPLIVTGDEVRLRQLLLILLDNALKYTDRGGRVDLSVLRIENRARLIVADTGIGIPQNDLPHIFDRFYRVDRAREHEGGGTGLGLAIAKWIAGAHGGTIRVESDNGKGTRFVVDLPLDA